MDPRVIALHDEALQLRPDDASHDGSLCPICVDWSLDESGVPACFDRLDEAQRHIPFGDVEYADPGYLNDGVRRYPLDSETHIHAVASLLEQEDVSARYSSDELKQMRQRTQSAMKQIGAKSHEAASDQEGEEGGTTPVSDTITQETHEALLAKAVDDATRDARAEIATLTDKVAELTGQVEVAEARVVELEEANEQVNGELDQAQVQLKAATEERDQLKSDIARRDEQAQIDELARARAEQVRNLDLFPEEYVTEKAQSWAGVPEEDWADRIEEWKKAKGDGTAAPSSLPSDQASAMSGSSDETPATKKTSSRRAVLGLD